ncbi:MAG TPA: hypothetical protein VIR33_12495 [Thermopolyspora sp.]
MSEIAPEGGDAEAEEMLAGVVDQPDTESDERSEEQVEVGPDGFPLNTPVADMAPEHAAAYWRHRARKHEKAVKQFGYSPQQVKEMAAKVKEIEDATKTEQELMAERLASAEQRALDAEVARARLLAAATHDLPPSLIDRLGGTTDEEIDEAARLLRDEIDAELRRRIAAMPAPEPPSQAARQTTSTRPVEALVPGAMPPNEQPLDGNDFLRRLAGR